MAKTALQSQASGGGKLSGPTTYKPKRITFSEGSQQNLKFNSFQNGPQRSNFALRRKKAISGWREWICSNCRKTNSGRFFTCADDSCRGQATDRQIPPESWQCNNRGNDNKLCAQNVWGRDHYCYCCANANPKIAADQLKPIPARFTVFPREEQVWDSTAPAIEP